MANLPESSTFDSGVYQIETSDPVIGGPSGVTNTPLKNLANRTKYLKDHVDAIEAAYAPKASPTFTGTPAAPTAVAGTNTTQIATTAFVKSAVDNGTAYNSLRLGGVLAADYAPKASPVFTGNPTAPTPALWDNDTSIATTEFVQRALGNTNGFVSLYANTILTAADFGKIIATGAGGITLTLPAPLTANSGGAIRVAHTYGTGNVIVKCPTGSYFSNIGGATQVTLSQGEVLTVYSDGDDAYWVDGNATLESLSSFASSVSTNGYQKLPGGLIMQWGRNVSASDSDKQITFPTAFPNGCFGVVATADPSAWGWEIHVVAQVAGYNASNFSIRINVNGDSNQIGQTSAAYFNWIALGY